MPTKSKPSQSLQVDLKESFEELETPKAKKIDFNFIEGKPIELPEYTHEKKLIKKAEP